MLILALMMIVTVVAKKEKCIDPATDQIVLFKERTKVPIGTLTTSAGAPVPYDEATNTLNTPLILNAQFLESIEKVVTEKIPERIVHAKGTGAFGYFTVTHNFTDICMADFLNKIGKTTEVGVRFSTTQGERGSSDLTRDIRGFSVKFYTQDGNFDFVGVNIPVYFYKDPIHFSNLVHGRRRNPATNIRDAHSAWDLLSLMPEAFQSFLIVFADRTIPASFTNLPSHAIHTYQFVNKNGIYHFCRLYLEPCAGIKTLTETEASRLRSMDIDYLGRDLFRRIANGKYPSWTLNAQVLTIADVKRLGFDVFDATKTISTKEFPYRPIGKLILNRNAKNHFADIEQMAFCPGNVVPGIIGAPDKLFESRVLAYRSAQVHRLGGNFNKIPVNCPFQTRALTYNRDGVGPVRDNEGDAPNYYPNSFNGPEPYKRKFKPSLIQIREKKANNFKQAGELYANDMTADERTRLVANLCGDLSVVVGFVQNRVIELFYKIHPDLSNRVAQCLNLTRNYDCK